MPDGEFLILRTDALDNAEDQLRLGYDRGLSKFVGRTKEKEALSDAAARRFCMSWTQGAVCFADKLAIAHPMGRLHYR